MAPRFDAIGLVVADMAKALGFYRELGLEFADGADDEGHETTVPGGIRLMFDTVEMVQSFSQYHPPAGGHRVALAFRCDGAADVDRVHGRLVAAGHRSLLDPFDAFWGQRYATVLDPDDNPVDLFA